MRFRSLLALLVLLFAPIASAQETTGTISGRVVDSQNLALPGVTITAAGPQGSKTAVSDSEGRFNIPFLTPGSYDIRAQLSGFKVAERKAATVGLGQTVDVPLKLEVGGVTETVNVTGTIANVDTSSTTIGAVLASDMLANIPVGRRVSDTLYLSPGVSSSGTAGRANPSISGGTGLENQYVVDGANITNTGYGGIGSYSITFGSLGNGTPYDFIKEVQVKTGGYEAEFGQATGGVVNVVTKSGTNLFRGSAFAYGQPKGLEGSWTTFQATNGSVSTTATSGSDVGLEGGGPIVKDRLFFFGAIDPSWQTTTFKAPAGFPNAALGDVDRKRSTVSYALKGTAQLGSGHRVDASFFGDPSKGDLGPQRTSSLLRGGLIPTSGFSTLDYGGHQQALRYDGVVGSKWLIEAAFARSLNTIAELPSVDAWAMTDTTVSPQLVTGGIGSYEKGNRSHNKQYTLKSTNLFGGHQVKYGIQYDDVVYSQANQRTGPTFLAPDGRTTATGASISVLPDVTFGKIYRVTRANFNSERATPQKYFNLFLQDSWKVGSRLTINPGIRYEQEKLGGTIITDFELKNNWAPRLGLTFDPMGDGRGKIYGSYGIYYARIPNDLAARALSADDGFTRGDYFDAALTRAIPAGTVTRTTATAAAVTNHFILAGVGADVIDPNAKLSYTNEFILGMEREVSPGMTISARYIFKNMPRVLEDVALYPMLAYDLGVVPNGGNVDYVLTNPSTATQAVTDPAVAAICKCTVTFDDPVHKYQALELTLSRRGENWSGTASYRYSMLRGNFEGFYRDDNGQSDPGISSLYDFPTGDASYKASGLYTGDIRFLGDPDGILPLDRPNQVKLFGNYMFNMGLNLGVNVNLSSGKPLTPMVANPNYSSAGEIPAAPRGSGIDTVDGRMTRTPFESQVDLQASYSIKVGGQRAVSLVADVFNLFDQERILGYDQNLELGASAVNPDYGKPVNSLLSGTPAQFQAPRKLRVGIKFSF